MPTSSSDFRKLTISQIHRGLLAKEFSAVEITREHLDAIAKKDPDIQAFLSVAEDDAIAQAAAVDVKIASGDEIAQLAGVPMAIKDNILIKGMRCTAGSKILEQYTASYDAGVITKLKKEQVVFLGKTNLDEFAMGSSTENSAFQKTKNPHDLTLVPGGSSGGSAAAVAGQMATAALGSDTGGSIRQPAAFCGVVGLKPTYGAVSRHGLIALASSLDQIGPFAKTVEDAAIIFSALHGVDGYDATGNGNASYDFESLTSPKLETVKKLKVGLPKEYFIDGLDPEIRRAIDRVVADIKSLGVEIREVSLPHTQYALSCYYIILPAEASANLARFDGIRYARADELSAPAAAGKSLLEKHYLHQRGVGFGPEPTRRILLGTFALSSGYYDAYYAKAQAVREAIRRDFDHVFEEVDVLLAPVTPTPPFKIGEKTNDPLSMYLSDIFTIPVNLAGLPGVSIPCRDTTSAGLPIGFQLIGRHFHEADILGLGNFYEQIRPR